MAEQLKTRVELITPEMAAEWLTLSKGNRGTRRRTIERYAEDMSDGRWVLTGEPIMFNGDGSLVNGHHRLHACIEADTPFRTVVVRGVPTEAMSIMDTGQNRTLADVLLLTQRITRPADAAIASSIASYSMRYDRMVEKETRQLAPSQFTRAQQLDFIDQHEQLLLRTLGRVIERKQGLAAIGSPGVFGFVHLIASRDAHAQQQKIDDFLGLVCDPAGLEEGEGPLMLRGTLLQHQQKLSTRFSLMQFAALSMKGMNLWLRGRKASMLKWNRRTGRGSGVEPFPRIVRLGKPETTD